MRLVVLFCLLAAPAFADPLPDPAALTKGLAETYTVKPTTPKLPPWASAATQVSRQLFVAKRGKRPRLQFQLTVYEHATPEAAKGTIDRFLATANPDWGHSYAFDHLFATGTRTIHLWAACTYSNPRADDLAARVRAWAAPASTEHVQCRCGGGCKREP